MTAHDKNTLTLDLAAFEGPLDLLLHLIKELKIDIFDIPMVLVTNQYMDYLKQMQTQSLDIASEYLVMAATLIEIKARMLLPKHEELVEEEEDPRTDLVEQLITYKQYQEISHILAEKQEKRQLEYPKVPSNLSSYQERIPLAKDEISTQDLFIALQRMAARLQSEQPVETTVQGDNYSVSEGMADILHIFETDPHKMIPFSQILIQHPLTRTRVVTLFLSLLELVKSNQIYLEQDQLFSEINIVRNGDYNENNG